MASVLGAAGLVAVRRSVRAGVTLLAFYGVQAVCLLAISRTLAGAWWSGPVRAALCAALLAVLGHRIATYAFPRPPAPRDRLLVPAVHVAQAWLLLELVAWPLRALLLPVSSSVDGWTVGAPLVVSVAGLAWTHARPRVTRVGVPLAALGRPLRVVHLSDLHLGPYLPDARLDWLADAIAAQRPDLVAITGDFLTLRTQHDWTPLLRFLDRVHAPEGVYACLGNHDVAVADALSATLRAHGVVVLRDEVTWLRSPDHEAVAVAGLDWRRGRDASAAYGRVMASMCADAMPAGPAVLLCHQPSAFELVPSTFAGIMLAGHLHGGQVGVTWGARGVSVLRLLGKYDQGLFTRGRARLYSHRGTGVYGFPLRLGVPSEIAVLDLRPEQAHEAATTRVEAAG